MQARFPRGKRLAGILLLFTAAALGMAGCGNDHDEGGGATATPSQRSATTATVAAGFILEPDGELIKAAAASSTIGD